MARGVLGFKATREMRPDLVHHGSQYETAILKLSSFAGPAPGIGWCFGSVLFFPFVVDLCTHFATAWMRWLITVRLTRRSLDFSRLRWGHFSVDDSLLSKSRHREKAENGYKTGAETSHYETSKGCMRNQHGPLHQQESIQRRQKNSQPHQSQASPES